MRTLLLILFLSPFAIQAQAQTDSKPRVDNPVAQPTAEQKSKLAELARTWEQKNREAEAARDKYLIYVFSTMAELGLKPSETSISWNDKGEPVFKHVEQAKTPPMQGTKP